MVTQPTAALMKAPMCSHRRPSGRDPNAARRATATSSREAAKMTAPLRLAASSQANPGMVMQNAMGLRGTERERSRWGQLRVAAYITQEVCSGPRACDEATQVAGAFAEAARGRIVCLPPHGEDIYGVRIDAIVGLGVAADGAEGEPGHGLAQCERCEQEQHPVPVSVQPVARDVHILRVLEAWHCGACAGGSGASRPKISLSAWVCVRLVGKRGDEGRR